MNGTQDPAGRERPLRPSSGWLFILLLLLLTAFGVADLIRMIAADRPDRLWRTLLTVTAAMLVARMAPQPGERVFRKTRYDGFCRTGLDGDLRAANIRYLLFTGVATNVCVESTARHAFFNEFWPILVEDAMNNSGPDFNRQATLWNFEHTLGWVTRSEDVMAALKAHTRETQPA